MRILHTESSCGWGGQELRVIADVQASAKRGHCVRICCHQESLFKDRSYLPSELFLFSNIKRKSLGGLLSMYWVIWEYRPDLVITHSSTDSWLVAIVKHLIPWRFFIIRVRHVSAPISSRWPTRWLYQQARYVVTTSEAIAELVCRQTGYPRNRILSIPTGVNCDYFRPAADRDRTCAREILGLSSNVFLVGMVATLRSWKGHRYVIEALLKCPDVFFVIAGDGPQRDNLRKQVGTYGLESRVTFLGHCDDVRVIYHALDVFVQPSTANEGVSQSVLQAMASGLPVIASDIGGLNEVISNEVDGYLVPPHDSKAIAERIAWLQKNSDISNQAAGCARRRVLEHYSLGQMESKMASLEAELQRT